MIELRTYRDGGQSAADVAREVAEFVSAAERTLELAHHPHPASGQGSRHAVRENGLDGKRQRDRDGAGGHDR